MKRHFKRIRQSLANTHRFLIVSAFTAGLAITVPQARAADYTLTFTPTPDNYVSTTGRITTAAFTVEMWFRQPSFDGENQLFLQDNAGAGRLILATKYGTNSFQIGNNNFKGNSNLLANTWYHVAFVRSSSGTGTIYLNGNVDKSAALNTQALDANGIVIGLLLRAKNGFRGQISDVRVWNAVRSQTDIKANMNARLTGTETGLIQYWPLNESIGATALNRTSNAHGTITGAAWLFSSDLPVTSGIPDSAWSASTGGNWSVPSNWLNLTPAQGVDNAAFFTNRPLSAINVTNDLSGLLLGKVYLSGSASQTFTGNGVTLTNRFVTAQIVSSEGAHTFGLPLATTARGVSLDTFSAAALSFTDVLSGPGAVSVNPATSGGGTVTLSGANTYTGPTSLGCGSLAFNTAANSGSASPLGAPSAANGTLALGAGTLRFTGGTASTDRGYTVNAPNKAAVIRVEAGGDLTFGGRIQTTSGGQVKTGPGTVRYTYQGPNIFSNINLNDALLTIGENGDGPSQGFYSYGIAAGRVIFDAPGQTNEINGRLCIGLYTTTNANAETAGELVVNDGVVTCVGNTLGVGRSNGTKTTAGEPGLSSKLTINGGTVLAGVLSVAFNGGLNLTNFNARPVITLNGGALVINQYASLAESPGSWTELTVRGGRLVITNAAASSDAISIGLSAAAGAREGVIILADAGEIDLTTDVNLAVQSTSTGTLHLADGMLTARNIVRTTTNGAGTVFFNGGLFRPRVAGRTMQGLTAAYVSTNGVRVDTSLAEFTISQNLLHDPALAATPDAGLLKLGTNSLALASYGSTYTGPTLVSNGTLKIAGALPPSAAVTVAPGAFLSVGGSATQLVAASSVTLAGNGGLAFSFMPGGSSNDRLSVASPPVLGAGRIALFRANTELPFTGNGTFTLIAYAGADPVVSGLTVANPVFGKTYSFAAAAGAVTVTVGLATASASIWNVDAGGAWATAGNWTVPPSSAAGSQARFDTLISQPVLVTTAGETVGELYFNSFTNYTLGGSGLTLDGGTASAAITVENGAHTIAAPLTLAGDTVLDIAPSSILNLGAASGASFTLTAQGNGTLALTAAPAVQSLVLNVPELSVSNTLTLASPVTLQRAVTVRPAPGTTTTVATVISGAAGVTKAGSSTLSPAAANTYTGPTTVSAGTLSANSLANGGTASSIGASPSAAANLVLGPATLRYTGPAATVSRGYTLASGSSPARTAVFSTDTDVTLGGQCACSSGAFLKTGPGTLRYTYPGAQTLAVAEGTIDALLNIGANGDSPTTGFSGYTVSNGKVILGTPGQTNTINVRITVGHYTTTAAGAETAGELQIDNGVFNCNTTVSIGRGNGTTATAPGGLTSRLTVNGGLVTINLIALGFKGIIATDFNARPEFNINGGAVTISQAAHIGESPGSVSTVNVLNGTLKINGQNFNSGLHLGGPQNPSGTGILNLSGTGVVDVAYPVTLATYAGGKGTINLNGGTLIASNIVKGAGSEAVMRFNGGVLRPRGPGATLGGLTAAYVSTNGALFDTALGSYTVSQNLLTDPGLAGAQDGGLAKLGTNTLSVTGTNTFTGPITVQAGLLRARVSSTNDLLVATNAFFDALSMRATIRNLTGNGTLTNGVIALTGALDAGTNNAPAGARMTVQNLSLVQGSTFICTWSTNGVSKVTNDFVTVTGTLAPEGTGFIDLGRSAANPIPVPFKTTIMSYGTLTGSFAGWKAKNTGIAKNIATVITTANNLVSLEIRYGGTLILIK